ncbi:MAG TPA: DUF748 domain-containing protein [Candidatus Polarisedimenticolia bacterium]|nr:DUF748 domain-containing protein [Candidatus Polarisedimenticolia bacterium]
MTSAAALVAVAAALAVADVALDEPLRRRMERALDQSLTGYSAQLDRLDLHVWGGSLDLYGLTISQDAHPDPPIGEFPRLTASVQWRALLRGRVVADVELERPALMVDLRQLQEESADAVPVERKGWQEAVEAIYPFKINELRVAGGELVYIDTDPERPLRLHEVSFTAKDIRNVRSRERTYPSEVMLEALVFDRGRLSLAGHADFLSQPHPGIKGRVILSDVELGYFTPVVERFGLAAHEGTLSAQGGIEYGTALKTVSLDELVIAGTHLEYKIDQAAAPREEARQEVVEAASELHDDPGILTTIDRFRVESSRLTLADPAADPPYEVFWSGIELAAENISNQPEHGEARARLSARFMGSGATRATASFRPASESPDFRLALSIEETRMASLNDLFRAHGGFDVVDGLFSFYTEVRVAGGRIEGYVKPLFRDVDVYDRAQDRHEGFWRRMWEKTVGVAAKLLKNEPRQEVATVMDLSGAIEDPRASTFQVVVNLVRNAFVEAILPGLGREVGEREPKGRRRGRDPGA